MKNWIKIEKEADLPKDDCEVFFLPTGRNKVELGFYYTGRFGDHYFSDGNTAIEASEVTHYQLIEFPELPFDGEF